MIPKPILTNPELLPSTWIVGSQEGLIEVDDWVFGGAVPAEVLKHRLPVSPLKELDKVVNVSGERFLIQVGTRQDFE